LEQDLTVLTWDLMTFLGFNDRFRPVLPRFLTKQQKVAESSLSVIPARTAESNIPNIPEFVIGGEPGLEPG